MEKQIVDIRFTAQTTISQSIVITKPGYTTESLLEGLNAEKIVTTVGHEQGTTEPRPAEVLDFRREADDLVIGYVASQDSDGEYEEFESDEDEDEDEVEYENV